MFIPKRLRDWKPEHMRRRPCRYCHWCCSGPHRLSEVVHVLESPMRYHFCKDTCLLAWQEHRHDVDVIEWLRLGAGERVKILKRYQDEEAATEGGRATPAVRGVDHVEVPVREGD